MFSPTNTNVFSQEMCFLRWPRKHVSSRTWKEFLPTKARRPARKKLNPGSMRNQCVYLQLGQQWEKNLFIQIERQCWYESATFCQLTDCRPRKISISKLSHLRLLRMNVLTIPNMFSHGLSSGLYAGRNTKRTCVVARNSHLALNAELPERLPRQRQVWVQSHPTNAHSHYHIRTHHPARGHLDRLVQLPTAENRELY